MDEARPEELAARPMTTAGLQAKVTLRRTWFEAHPNQPMPEGRAQVEELFAAIEEDALRAVARPADGEGLRAYAEAALTDFVAEHGSDFDAVEWPGMAALRSALDARPISQDLHDAAVEVLRLGNQPGLDDDEWEAAMAALEAALATPNDLPKLFHEYRDWGIAIGRAKLDPERLARAMSRLAEVGPPAHLNVEQAEDHWRSYLTEATDLAAEYAALAANPSPEASHD